MPGARLHDIDDGSGPSQSSVAGHRPAENERCYGIVTRVRVELTPHPHHVPQQVPAPHVQDNHSHVVAVDIHRHRGAHVLHRLYRTQLHQDEKR